jgi:hypothetical protein
MKACNLFGGGTAPPPISAAQRQSLVAFAGCMRGHGVPNYPDPAFPAGGAVQRKISSTLGPSAPAVARARKACGKP